MKTANMLRGRRRTQQLAKKRARDGPVILKTPRTQQLENEDRARRAAEANRARMVRVREKEETQALEKQDRLVAQAAAVQRVAHGTLHGEDAPLSASALALPAAPAPGRPRVTKTSGVRLALRLPEPEFHPAVREDGLLAPLQHLPKASLAEIRDFVQTHLDVAVLCAWEGHGVTTWNHMPSCLPPSEDAQDAPDAQAWREWLAPPKWQTLVKHEESHDEDDEGAIFKDFASPGNYNNVMALAARGVHTVAKNAALWPPQIGADRLDSELYVVRMTRSDAFPCSSGRPLFRAMKRASVIDELSMTLHAASLGIGPRVYAAVCWPWKRTPGMHANDQQRYGIVMVLERAPGDMITYQNALMRNHPPESAVSGPSRPFRESAELAAAELASLCAYIAHTGYINFDMKPGNLLMSGEPNGFYMSDFDTMYYRMFPDDVAGLKARLLVNLTLLGMHVRAYSKPGFATSFLGMLTPLMAGLWRDAVGSPESFGPGASWLTLAPIAYENKEGAFNHHTLCAIPDLGRRAGRQLTMMVFEYLFDKTQGKKPPQRAEAWTGWQTKQSFVAGRPPLMPQLLRFVLFYNKPIPEAYEHAFPPGN